MISKRWMQRAFTVAVVCVSCSIFFCSEICRAKTAAKTTKVHTYKEGFTYQKLDSETIARMRGKSYKKGAKIPLSRLRSLRLRYIDFDGREQDGEMIVHKKIAKRTCKVFYELYRIKYPIAGMQLVDEYDADDEASMAANNTSSFNYRKVANSSKMSKHSQGLAIDINPRINPYITKYGIAPANSKVYRNRNVATCRGKYRDYMIHRGDEVYRIFKKNGFSWGGDWKYSKDYQHFER
jgi:hypothetical protein